MAARTCCCCCRVTRSTSSATTSGWERGNARTRLDLGLWRRILAIGLPYQLARKVVVQAASVARAFTWIIPARVLSAALLRAYTAVSPNKLGNLFSIVCGAITIVIAYTWPGTEFERVTAAVLASGYLRLVLLEVLYRRYFSAAISYPL